MPTLPPKPLEPPKSEAEREARESAFKLIDTILASLDGYAYSTRSHMPLGIDYTDFTNSIFMILKFCANRPDWTLECVKNALKMSEIYNIFKLEKKWKPWIAEML